MHTGSECFVEGTNPIRCQEEDTAIVFEDSEENYEELDFQILKSNKKITCVPETRAFRSTSVLSLCVRKTSASSRRRIQSHM